MITPKAKKKAEIVSFFKRFGLEATISAFKASKSSIYLWHRVLNENKGNIESLNEGSRAPHRYRQSAINQKIIDFIEVFRVGHPRAGKTIIKPELDEFCEKESLNIVSLSTVGRIINDLKKKGKIPKQIKISLYGKTGNIIIRDKKPRKKKIRRNGYQPELPGDLLQIDTIVKFIWGIKRYVITAVDLKSKFTFAMAYSHLSSKTSQDFFKKLEAVAPFKISRAQTDNGMEFLKRFREELERKRITHFFTYPRRPQQNAHIESFNRTIQEDFINWHQDLLANNIHAFNQKLIDWLLWYNTKRPHSSINRQSPVQYLIETLGFSKMLWTYAHNVKPQEHT